MSYTYSDQIVQTKVHNCSGNEEIICPTIHQSCKAQTIQKVDVATMTDPLKIDFRLTSGLGKLPYAYNYEENNCHPKIEYDIPEPYYYCSECTYRFEDRETLQKHLEDHKQRPYVCDICGASLKRKEHLERHKISHNTDRPFQCCICCKAFKRSEHLQRHAIIHSGRKTHICSECGKGFYRKDHMVKHLLSHSNRVGNKSLKNSSNLANQENQQSTFSLMMRQTQSFSILRT